ncbi:hypothetical protein TVAG_109690 [Trichomonas vaginalis G3]|uniref:Uncharacterized protein n=1 Tax=Trichomonas vaginalis (strain ATCC PRA-98 / G3) TaxID=412133 RepID=A2EAF8_TRIV3|nr:hypothetical protein TVAG_109690 [Trichomonas vaginalis G3]|eukprot:XP_001322608.1 hypothetical protein [Trichomonas vaginalis G3]
MTMKQQYFQVPSKDITSLYFHPDGKKLLVTSKTSGLLMYSLISNKRPFAFRADNFSPIRGVISKDGELIVGASFEGKVALWKNHQDKPIAICQGHSAPINDMAIHYKAGCIMTASNDKCIKLWDQNLKFIKSFTAHSSQVTACAFDQNGKIAISGDASGTILLWDFYEPEKGPVWDFHMCQNRKDPIKSIDIDSNGGAFLVLTEKGHLGLFAIRNPEYVIAHPFKAAPFMAKLHPKLPFILCTSYQKDEIIYDATRNSVLFTCQGHENPIIYCAWSHMGDYFATADNNGVVIYWPTPQPPKTAPIVTPRKSTITIEPQPLPLGVISIDILVEELNILTAHVNEYNAKLADQEERVTDISQEYRWQL